MAWAWERMMPTAGLGEEAAPTGGSARRPRARIAAVVLAVGLLAGLVAAQGLNAALGIEYSDRQPPVEPEIAVDEVRSAVAFEPVATVVVPDGDAWLARAADRLAVALEMRTGERPAVEPERSGPGRAIAVQSPAADPRLDEPQAFLLDGEPGDLTLVSQTRQGQIGGVYWLADRVLAGASEPELLGRSVAPDLPRRLVDLGGVGAPDDPTNWDPTDYSHGVRNLEQAVLPGEPYVDEEAFARVEDEFVEYLDHVRAYGNNGIIQGGFLGLIDFDRVDDGEAVYAADSPYRTRHRIVGEHLSRLWETADDAGMEVYLSHTQLALTPPLERYLLDRFGTIDAEDPRLWEVYQAGLAELFERYDEVDGVVLRIGEAGSIYDPQDGLAYSTRLEVRTDEAVRTMLEAFLEVAEDHDRDIIFRTWTVGIGEVGALHHRAEVYERVLGDLDHPNLIVSTKYVEGDFYRYIPLNETLYTGDHRRILELQNRLEFEGFMAFPNLIGPLHGAALADVAAANENLEGVWQWNQNGGPQQAGPMSLYPFVGFWHNIDANVYTTSRHAVDLDADPGEVAADWVRRTFGDDPEVVEPLTEMLSRSREAAAKGLYVSAYAEQLVTALGLETTPMMWIFEWDIVSGSSSVLSTTYYTARGDVDAAIAEGEEAVTLARGMRELVAGVDPQRVRDPQLLDQMVDSLDYEVDLFETLAAWRTTFLRYYQWLDTGDPAARDAWKAAVADFETRRADHVATYGGDLDFPAYNFVAVEAGLVHVTRGESMAWLARALVTLLLIGLALGGLVLTGRLPHRGGLAVAAALTRALVTPAGITSRGRPHRAVGGTSGGGSEPAAVGDLVPPGRRERGLLVLLPAGWLVLAFLTFSSFASWHYPTLMALVVGTFCVALIAVARRRALTVWTSVVVWLLVLVGVLLSVVAVRGPVGFWYRFWTDAGFRTWFTTVSVLLGVWLVHAIVVCLRRELGRRRRVAAGGVLLASGVALVAVGAVPGVAGLERMLTGLNDELAVLPLGLSRILGITTHLDIPTALPLHLAGLGIALAVLGGLLLLAARRPAATAATGPRGETDRLKETRS